MLKISCLMVLCVMAALWVCFRDDLPRKYKARKCTGRRWKKEFPEAGKTEIRSFLLLFVDAFAFYEKHKLKFEPEDKLLDIYAALYSPIVGDNMEFENLGDDIKEVYGEDLDSLWNDQMTLGELFARVRKLNSTDLVLRG